MSLMLKLQEHTDDIIKLYQTGKSPTEISKIYKCYLQPVTNLLKRKLNISSLLPCKGDTNYFSIIDTFAKAYILGFIAADGALVRPSKKGSPTLTITVKYSDKCVLEFIRSEIGNCHNLQEIKRKNSFDPNKDIYHIRYTITDKQIAEDLIRLGITPVKSLTLENILPNISSSYRKAFIIGYFDGDGSVCLPKSRKKFNKSKNNFVEYPSHRLVIDIRGTYSFLKGIATELDFKSYGIKHYDSIPRLQITNKSDIVKFFKCYDGLPFYLERKYVKFLSRISHPSYRLL